MKVLNQIRGALFRNKSEKYILNVFLLSALGTAALYYFLQFFFHLYWKSPYSQSILSVLSVISVIFFSLRFKIKGAFTGAGFFILSYYIFFRFDGSAWKFIPVSRYIYNFALLAIGILVGYIYELNKRLKLSLKIEDDLFEKLQEATLELADQSMTDSLTGIFNRRYFMEIASKTFHACRRHRKSFSIVIADLDHFKSINDTYGHGAGDLVLKKFANYFQEELRESDVLARFGGEEFIALLPDTTEQQSLVMIERIRKGLSELKIDIEDNRAICITASFGISEFRDSDENYESIFLRADRALYQAKESGRNSVILAE